MVIIIRFMIGRAFHHIIVISLRSTYAIALIIRYMAFSGIAVLIFVL